MSDNIEDFKFTCKGGLDNKNTFLEVSEYTPGAALQLVNFEPSLYGGYRRINGFQPLSATYEEVDSSNAEEKVLGVFIHNDEIYAARKQTSGTTYKIYRFDSGSGWVAQSPGFTLNTTDGTYTVERVNYDIFSFDGDETIIFADGVNYAYMFDGSNWTQIKSTNTGTNFADAGGANALDKPSLVEIYEGHIFLSGDPTAEGVIAHSSPQTDYDWLTANGAGQVVTGFTVSGIRVWRDFMYTFGIENIGYIGVSSTNFVFKNVSTEIGCIAPQSIVEIDGDLMYLSQDGFRVVEGTDRINDIEIGVRSKKIQRVINNYNSSYTSNDVVGVVIPSKSQVRFFWNLSSVATAETQGILVGLRENIDESVNWEWGKTLGIQAYVATTGRISGIEYVIHGDYAGNVYRQEVGSSFNGGEIQATYSTPHLDFGEPMIRKKLRDIHAFVRSEGTVNLVVSLSFDWGDNDKPVPDSDVITDAENTAYQYGDGSQYGDVGVVYGAGIYPLLKKSTQGTARAFQLTFSTAGTESPYSIQTIIMEFTPERRR